MNLILITRQIRFVYTPSMNLDLMNITVIILNTCQQSLLGQTDIMCLTPLGAHAFSPVGDPVRGATHQQPVHDGPGRGRWQDGERCRCRRRRGLLRVLQGTEPPTPRCCAVSLQVHVHVDCEKLLGWFFFFTFSSPSTSWLGFWVFTRDRLWTGCCGLHVRLLSCPTKRAPSVAIKVAERAARPPPGSTAW